MKENLKQIFFQNKINIKEKILPVILLIVLISVVGLTSYAFWFNSYSTNANTITSGLVSMSYTESSNVITISDALPMTDDNGMIQTNYFDFSVTSNMTLNSTDPNGSVNYDIELELLESDSGYNTLSNNQVKVYLEDISNGVVSVVEPTLVNDLTTSTTGKIIYSTSHAHSSSIETVTTNYRLRAWIDMDVSADNFSTTGYEYKFRVNVVGEASALSKPKIASVSANNLTVTASISSETEIKSFGFSEDENTEPTTWIDASGHLTEVSSNNKKYNISKLFNGNLELLSTNHNYSLTYTFDNVGEYYLWLRDKLNNVVSYDEPFVLENFYDSLMKSINTSVVPNYNYISNYNKNGINVNDNGLFLYNGTDDNNGDKDIYYYRGNVTNNNVLFGGFCWKIFRTTSTGGTKMIYNGIPSNGSCNNTGAASQIADTSYSVNNGSPTDVGYMFGTKYKYSTKTMTSIEDAYVYGNDVVYEDGTYTLVDTVTSVGTDWSTDRKNLANGKHYTCLNTAGTCSKVYYITYFGSTTDINYLTFSNGDTLDSAKEKMYVNTTNSYIKSLIDKWYKNNLIDYSSFLENTIFCNERTLYKGPLYSKDDSSLGYSFYITYQRMESGTTSLTCLNNNDKFSLSVESGGTENYGNNALTYPIGLITADEMNIAGGKYSQSNTKFYLRTGKTYRTLSPNQWGFLGRSYIHELGSNGNIGYSYAVYGYGARPVISLKYGTTVSGGDGSYTNPYVVG